MNDNVKIKITERGINRLLEIKDHMIDEYPDNSLTLEEIKNFIPEIDENGFIEMQMHKVMEIFGNYYRKEKLPFEPNIIIEEKYLKNVEQGKKI